MDKPISRRVGSWFEILLPNAVYAYAQWDAPVFHLIGNMPRTEEQFAPSITLTLTANTPTRCIYNQPTCTFHQVLNLPTIYQISIDPITDIGIVSDNSIGDYSSSIGTDTFLAYDDLTGSVWAEPKTDTLNVQDILSCDGYGSFNSDTPIVSDIISSETAIHQSSSDIIFSAESLLTEWHVDTTDTVSLLGVLMGTPQLLGVLYDNITFADSLTGVLVSKTAVTDIISLVDIIAVGFVADNSDTITLTDNQIGLLSSHTAATDTLNASETLGSSYYVYGSIADSCVLTDVVSGTAALIGALTPDTITAIDSLVEATQKIIVINSDTGAVSTYTFTQTITGLTNFNGTLYFSSLTGLYALDSATDVGTSITWTVETGFSNLGSDLLKRVMDVNIQGRTTGTVQCIVTVNRTNVKRVYGPFILPTMSYASYNSEVIKIAKGIQSNYWQLRLSGTDSAEIDQLHYVVEPLGRRR